VNALASPFRFEGVDTMRDYGSVALTYAWIWVTALLGAVLAWRRVTRSD
jgi:hypothetical protein